MKDWQALKNDLVELFNQLHKDDLANVPAELAPMFELPTSPVAAIGTEEELALYLDGSLYSLIKDGYITQEIVDRHDDFFRDYGIPTNLYDFFLTVEKNREEMEESEDSSEKKAVRRRWRRQLGDRLRTMRLNRDLNIRQAAELSGVDKNAISRIEAGRVNAYIDSIFSLIEVYGGGLIIDPTKREIR